MLANQAFYWQYILHIRFYINKWNSSFSFFFFFLKPFFVIYLHVKWLAHFWHSGSAFSMYTDSRPFEHLHMLCFSVEWTVSVVVCVCRRPAPFSTFMPWQCHNISSSTSRDVSWPSLRTSHLQSSFLIITAWIKRPPSKAAALLCTWHDYTGGTGTVFITVKHGTDAVSNFYLQIHFVVHYYY